MRFYVGPYIRVRVPQVKTPRNTPWCSKCDMRCADVNFCADCGTELTLKADWFSEPSPHWSIPATCVLRYAVTDEPLKGDYAHYIYVIGNGCTNFNEVQPDEPSLGRFWHGHWNERGVEDLSGTIIPEEISWLRARCSKEIESLCRVFGETNVGFGWGAVTGWR